MCDCATTVKWSIHDLETKRLLDFFDLFDMDISFVYTNAVRDTARSISQSEHTIQFRMPDR